MPEPVRIEIKAAAGLWTVTRDGAHVVDFSHADRAVHEAVRLARELEETGEPASVHLHAADGKVIEVDVDPVVTQAEELRGPDAINEAKDDTGA